MKPLFNALKSHEQVVVRPHAEVDARARILCRVLQWVPIWSASGSPTCSPAALVELAKQQATQYPQLEGSQLFAFFKKMSVKAPGPDGWDIPFIKKLEPQHCDSLVELFTMMEREAALPHQMQFSLVVLLPKNETIERPIALMHCLLKAYLKMRWPLISQWLEDVDRQLWWDSAKKGTSTLDVSLKRMVAFEGSRCNNRHRVTLFVDLTTFYEGVPHEDLIRKALAMNFPAPLLNFVLQAYKGPRLIQCEEGVSPVLFASKGIQAGCPLGPILAKVALADPCEEALSGSSAKDTSVWIDDIAVDAEELNPGLAARNILALSKRLFAALRQRGHTPSASKTYFLASSKEAEQSLKRIRAESDPPVSSLGRDLGITTAGARRRTTKGAMSRFKKGGKRLQRLHRLQVPQARQRARLFSASVLTSGLWGHQGQGVSPKNLKMVRFQAAVLNNKHKLGSVDITLDLQEHVKDPMEGIIVQHWRAMSKLVRNDLPWFVRTWDVLSSGLQGQHRWKKVAGPTAALIAYLKDLNVEASNVTTWIFPKSGYFGSGCPAKVSLGGPFQLYEVEDALKGAIKACRWDRISKQDSCESLKAGIDWTVQRSLCKDFRSQANKLTALRAVWQGAVLTSSKGSRSHCPLCHVPGSLEHVLHDCKWWQHRFPKPGKSWDSKRKDFPWASLWNRGLVPAAVTQHPPYPFGPESIEATGIWVDPSQITSEVFFSTDASGGPKGNDPRLRIVSWAVVAFTVKDQSIEELGHLSGTLAPGTSVFQGEAHAVSELLTRFPGACDNTMDCKGIFKLLQKPTFHRSCWPGLSEGWEHRRRVSCFWVNSHLDEKSFGDKFGQSNEWRRKANQAADRVCGEKSARVFSHSHARFVSSLDSLTREVNLFLADRAWTLLTSEDRPPLAEVTRFAKKATKGVGRTHPKTKKAQQQNRPAADGGLNKKQRLQNMVDSPQGGHVWKWSSKHHTNASIVCSICSLYIEQCHDLDKFRRLESQACEHQPSPWPSEWICHASHRPHNLGNVWLCKACHAVQKSGAASTSRKFQEPCKYVPSKVSKYASRLPQPNRQPFFSAVPHHGGAGKRQGVRSLSAPERPPAGGAMAGTGREAVGQLAVTNVPINSGAQPRQAQQGRKGAHKADSAGQSKARSKSSSATASSSKPAEKGGIRAFFGTSAGKRGVGGPSSGTQQ